MSWISLSNQRTSGVAVWLPPVDQGNIDSAFVLNLEDSLPLLGEVQVRSIREAVDSPHLLELKWGTRLC